MEALEENSTLFHDRLTYFELRADLLFKLGKIAEAEDVYMRLLDRNPDCVDYMKRIEECKAICNPSEIKQISKEFYKALIEKYPRNRVVKLRSLLFMDKDEFQQNLLEFIVAGLRSGLPSLFNCVSMFYKNQEEVRFSLAFTYICLGCFYRKVLNRLCT